MVNSNLRVLFISHAYVVGVNQGKLKAIAQTGKAVVGLLTPSNWKALEWNRLMPLETPDADIKTYSAPVLFPGKVGAYVFSPWKLWQVLKDFKPHVVQVELEVFSLGALELAILCRILGKPLVIFGWENLERRLSWLRRWVRKFVMSTAKLIIAGNRDGEVLLRQWGYSGLIEVMPQIGVDAQLFAASTRESRTGSKHEFHIGYLGRLAHQKGVDIILTALHQLRDSSRETLNERGLNCRLIICGSGAEEEALRQEAEKLQINDLITWKGGVSHHQAPEAISQFDVLVLPSRTTSTWKEQFGHVLIEAMAMGVPVVGSDSGDIPNVIGRDDLVFPEEDAAGLAAILERMIKDPEWCQEAGKYGMERVYQNYTHEKIAARSLDLWNRVLTSKNQQYVDIAQQRAIYSVSNSDEVQKNPSPTLPASGEGAR
jgi:glycosyltransferase involved in cell wall biosynthesis